MGGKEVRRDACTACQGQSGAIRRIEVSRMKQLENRSCRSG